MFSNKEKEILLDSADSLIERKAILTGLQRNEIMEICNEFFKESNNEVLKKKFIELKDRHTKEILCEEVKKYKYIHKT